MTTRQSDAARNEKLHVSVTDGFVIEKEFPVGPSTNPRPRFRHRYRLPACRRSPVLPVPFAADPFAVIPIRGKQRSGLRTAGVLRSRSFEERDVITPARSRAGRLRRASDFSG